jgi:predicted ribosome quality control (RQC) complex YloA/Tae2 family protein
MHNSHLFLKQLSSRLNEILVGFRLVSCFSQNKDELIIEFNNGEQSFFIKAYLHPEFCCLSFPSTFKRARKNSIDLFNSLLLKKITRIISFHDERAFAIELESSSFLFFKMFGNQSNVILFEGNELKEIFRNNFKNDFELKLNSFQPIEPIKLSDPQYFIIKDKGRIQISLDSKGEVIKKFTDPIAAINEFFYLRVSTDSSDKEKSGALRVVHEKEKRTRQYLKKVKSELKALSSDSHYHLWADLIMANLHNIKKGTDKISLQDFSSDKIHEIKLKKELTPQQNAAVFYRKAKNKTLEIKKLTEAIVEKEELLKKILSTKENIEIETEKEKFTGIITASGLQSKSKHKEERLPYRMVEFMDYTILIGKNAVDNDELTLKHTYKEDLWLHAKDVSGSHVVIKYQSGKNFPKNVIERAAQLAAFFSKRKGETLCPVAYTEKKFVRKRKGDPPGLVVVEKERVIMVEPKG